MLTVRRRVHEEVYLLAERSVMGAHAVSFQVRRGLPRAQIISAAAFLACCLAYGEEVEDRRLLARVGADGPPAPELHPLVGP